MRCSEDQSGFTFVEVLVASVVLVVGVLGTLAVFAQAFHDTTSSGRSAVLNHLAAAKLEEIRALPAGVAELNAGIHPEQAADSAGEKFYPVSGFDEDFSLRWQVSGGPTDGAGNPEPGIKTVVVEATYRVRYTVAGAPLMNTSSLEASIGTLVTN